MSSSPDVIAAAPVMAMRRSAFDRERWLTGAAVLLVVLLLVVIVALPVGALVGQSFFDHAGAFVGLANFARYLDNPALVQSAFNSLGLAAISAVICTGIAYVYAYGLTLSCMPAKGVLRAVALIPLLAPSLLPACRLLRKHDVRTVLLPSISAADLATVRQGGDGFRGPLRPFEGAGTAEAEVQALRSQPFGVLRRAGIAVDDALGLVFFEQGVNVGVGVAVVHDDGLVQLQRQPDVCLKHGQLGILGHRH